MTEALLLESAPIAQAAAPIMSVWTAGEPIRGEVFGLEHLEAHARRLASECTHVRTNLRGVDPRRQFRQSARELERCHRLIAAIARAQGVVSGGAEWLLDNYYIVVDNLWEVRRDMPARYYLELPKIMGGIQAGWPRVYILALELIAHTDCAFDEVSATRFVRAFQTVTPLTIGELWAVPTMLRLGILENLHRLAARIVVAGEQRQEAEMWKSHLLKHKDSPAEQLDRYLAHPARRPRSTWSDTFMVQLFQLLRDQGADANAGMAWLERHLLARTDTVQKLVSRENQRQAADQLSIGNSVTSLRLLGALDWSSFVEETSLVEAELRHDPAGAYRQQDFATRDRYRREVEVLARGARLDEIEVARRVVEAAGFNIRDSVRGHIGYYLIGAGRIAFEHALGYRPRLGRRFEDGVRRHPEMFFFGSLTLITVGLVFLALFQAWTAGSRGPGLLGLTALVVVLPAGAIAVGLVNFLVTRLLPPTILPRMDYKEGSPEECAAFIVIPTILSRPGIGRELAKRLEIHYLSNSDRTLYFALLTDFPDAPQEVMPGEADWLQEAVEQIGLLNQQYAAQGPNRFFLCHRQRRWNPAMRCWMGWERKRGKLQEFGRLIRGARDTTFSTISGAIEKLPFIRYVITLDTDTRLPREAARKLTATLHHPLNRPRLDEHTKRVVAGYGLLQPRVSLPLATGGTSWFNRLYSDSAGLDPYTTAVSDVYQDLFGQGSFTGKGIYDVDAFEHAVGNRFPENLILSHDLIEGNFARCGLVTDVELLDEFPQHFVAFERREHRWMRGDWQIAPWLFGRTPSAHTGSIPNPLPLLERWKILDNLRRSLEAPALVILILLGSAVLPGSPWIWIATALGVVFLPFILQVPTVLVNPHDPLAFLRRDVRSRLAATIGQCTLRLVFLMEQCRSALDAIGRTLWRMLISQRRLLEWESAAATESRVGNQLGDSILAMWPTSLATTLVAFFLWLAAPHALTSSGPFLVVWLLSPWIAHIVSRPRAEPALPLSHEERVHLRNLARLTWGFFEKFVTAEDNWLPPDNYQEDPKGEVAHRTSPTNLGLYLVSVLAAHDLGYVAMDEMLDRLENTFDTLDKLDRRHGHFCNWYDTRTLVPLHPVYISTVDSGNLLACFVVLRRGLQEKLEAPFVNSSWQSGLEDSLALLEQSVASLIKKNPRATASNVESITNLVQELKTDLRTRPMTWVQAHCWLMDLRSHADSLPGLVQKLAAEAGDSLNWIVRWSSGFVATIYSLCSELAATAPWLGTLTTNHIPLELATSERWKEIELELQDPGSMATLAASLSDWQSTLAALIQESSSEAVRAFLEQIQLEISESIARATIERANQLSLRAIAFENAMDFRMLYNEQRRLFSIGYNESLGRLDPSHYDLLASEACLTSFQAIARSIVPRQHWFQLGRAVTRVPGGISLISWGGTMFEYLMPRLFLRPLPGTLLHESQYGAVRRQMEYARDNSVPWGMSESGFNALDSQLNYQYQAFGVPGLGLKRGLAQDLVVAPYATMLALAIMPHKARENLQALANAGALGEYGMYESIDFTRDRLKRKRRLALVRSYMAHHQGMSLVALDNCLMGDPMPRRFHSEPMVRATDLLLQERPPAVTAPAWTAKEEAPFPSLPEPAGSLSRRVTTAQTAHPRMHLLSNGRYNVMVTSAGAGYSSWLNLDVTRWREDRVRDNHGQFVYLRDLHSRRTWSVGNQPLGDEGGEYEVIFSPDKVDLRRIVAEIETHMEITVSPESDAEVRRLTLTNHGRNAREIQVTSYAEIVLLPHQADVAHLAFGKLFLETEFIEEHNALLCRRRPRSAEQAPVWAVHVLAGDGELTGQVGFETDRATFLGRGRSPRNPAALLRGAKLGGNQGPVLDPIFSLRCDVRIEPGAAVCLAFTTAVATSREAALALADHYDHLNGVTRAFELAWAHSQVELRQMQSNASQVHLFQRLAAQVIYAGTIMRRASDVARNLLGQARLWPFGISGDLPIVLVRAADQEDLGLVSHLLSAHAYWRLKGLAVDLILLNEHPASYIEALHEQLQALIRASDDHGWENKAGGVFLLRACQLREEEVTLLHASARVVLDSRLGSLVSQLERQHETRLPASLRASTGRLPSEKQWPQPRDTGEKSLSAHSGELFWNGKGGFSHDGREYVIRMRDGLDLPPAPWINVVANPKFGFLVSEAGSSSTWSVNSQQFRLSGWGNDPTTDGSSEWLYLRDEASGEYWTPTPRPRAIRPIVVRHGQGYSVFEHTSNGIGQELTLTADSDDSVKFIRLRLHNHGTRSRSLSVWFFVEWVLGETRERAADHVRCWLDADSGALMAANRWQVAFADQIAFLSSMPSAASFTVDRGEFLGRNGDPGEPAALTRVGLSNHIDPLADPCAAMQVKLHLEPGELKDILFVLGCGTSLEDARQLAEKHTVHGQADKVLRKVVKCWDAILEAVQIKTPDPAFDLMINRRLLHQVLSSRVWGRTAFYQSSGAFGFRDQLQDVLALVHTCPEVAREHILRAASRQFIEGDVQHWWHPPTGKGVRTRISDDLLWLPFVVSAYVSTTEDRSILDALVDFIRAPLVATDREEDYGLPETANTPAPLYEHCRRALDKGFRLGEHGLPLIGTGDWNDGMNRVGAAGKGESIWLAWFLARTLHDFAPLAEAHGDLEIAEAYRKREADILAAVEQHGWDGAWYRRAYFDNGTPLGSAENSECRIDVVAQAWAVMAGGNPVRAGLAMKAVREQLVLESERLILILTPPFDKGSLEPGYIKGYLPGIRENGGQYSHAATWVVQAAAMLGEGTWACELFSMLNPIMRTRSLEDVARYRVEPYVLAGDVYHVPPHVGRGGWSWYTGSAAWLYRIGLESILGFRRKGSMLTIDPCITSHWPRFDINYRFGSAHYEILVWNMEGVERGVRAIKLDGIAVTGSAILLVDDGGRHRVEVEMGPAIQPGAQPTPPD